MSRRYNENFFKEIKQRNMDYESKKWHKAIKKLTRYTQKSDILNLEEGPIAEGTE